MKIKETLAKLIKFEENTVNYSELITESSSSDKGDFCLPCFALSKVLHENPMTIAEKVKNSIEQSELIDHVEIVAGYVNFFLNKAVVSKLVIGEILNNPNKLSIGEGKTVCIDYSSVNLAKYMHIGHLKNTIIGESIARICEYLGFKVVRINYIGDYGTPFGKIIVGLEKWGNAEDVKQRGIDALQEYYVKFNQEAENDPSLDDEARLIFKKIENKDEKYYPIYCGIIEIAKKEAERLLNLLGVKFDSWKGEASYSEKLNYVVNMLTEKGLTKISEGATIVDLSAFDMAPCLIKRSDGASLYATRDIAAAIDRFNTYHFDKMIYVTGIEQKLHFKQFFKVLELAGFDFASNLEHLAYGRFSLPDGKISSRRGKQAVLVDLINYAKNKASEVIANRTFSIEKPEDVAWKVARGALNFNALKVEVYKDCVFDIDKAFSFEGETAPYMQYTYTRISSILRKAKEIKENANYDCLNTEESFALIKLCNDLNKTVLYAYEKQEPSILVKHGMEICKNLNKFYANTKILEGNEEEISAKLNLLKVVRNTLQKLFHLICIDTLEEM